MHNRKSISGRCFLFLCLLLLGFLIWPPATLCQEAEPAPSQTEPGEKSVQIPEETPSPEALVEVKDGLMRIPVMVTSQFGLMVTTHRSEATPVFFL